MVSKKLRVMNMGLVSRLREEVEDSDDEGAVCGILAALFLALPAAVRKTDPATLLRANGFCSVEAWKLYQGCQLRCNYGHHQL